MKALEELGGLRGGKLGSAMKVQGWGAEVWAWGAKPGCTRLRAPNPFLGSISLILAGTPPAPRGSDAGCWSLGVAGAPRCLSLLSPGPELLQLLARLFGTRAPRDRGHP